MEKTTAIEVLAKTTTETLRIKNEEFLAKYPTDDSQIDYYTDLARKVFDEFEIDGTHEEVGVRKNVATWFHNKKSLMELFRKHPYWNEEAKAIIFVQDELRTVNYNNARKILGEINDYICHKYGDNVWSPACLGIYYTLMEMYDNDEKEESTITDNFIRRFKNNVESTSLSNSVKRMLKVGTKITKFARKCFTEWERHDAGEIIDATTFVDDHEADDRTYNSFDKMYAKFADALSELVIKKITLVSLHFCDFMTMSNGNSWSSCHFINSHNIFHEESTSSYSGCYKQGCLSYALDNPSFLLYTLPNTYEGEEYYRQQKMNRMCCQYEEGILVTGKCYPDNQDHRITRYRQMLQLILSTIEDVPNLWTFSRKVERIKAFVEAVDGSAHYCDYESCGQKPTISMCKYRIDLDHMMSIGHVAYCVHCGESLEGTDQKWLQCERHRKKPICSNCGCHIEEGNRIEIDGNYYCKDCCFWCDHHERYEVISRGRNELELTNGDTMIICNTALNYYFRCTSCGKWHSNRSRHQKSNGSYCKHCYQELKSQGLWPTAIELIPCDHYNEGDYVVVVSNPDSVNSYSTNIDMMRYYPNKIARLVQYEESMWDTRSGYYITIDGESCPWIWSTECFVGKLIGNVNDSILGKTLEEVMS